MPNSARKDHFEDFVEATRNARSRARLFELLVAKMATLGLEHVKFSVIRDDQLAQTDQGIGLINTFPSAWQALYLARKLDKIDPVLYSKISGFDAFRWRDLERLHHLSGRQRRFLRMAHQAGLYNGIGIPFAGPRTQRAGIALASSSKSGGLGVCLDLLTAYSNHFYLAYKRIVGRHGVFVPTLVSLTDRERDILIRVAHGRSNDQIAELLGIEPSTVDFHIRNLFKKLDVNNRAAATSAGIRNGLIEP